ncbi:PilZ domain-containing protein [Planctomicrobium piriforme]|nr:PilZ domain-containing protein [Planctomicrobium piriforme]
MLDDIATVIEEIRESYCRGCLRCTGDRADAWPAGDRRSDPRESIAIPFYLSPSSEDGQPTQAPVIAVTRDLSSRGIGFQCDEPIKGDFFIAEFDSPEAHTARLLLEIRWRQKKSPHHYVAGAHILRVLPDQV